MNYFVTQHKVIISKSYEHITIFLYFVISLFKFKKKVIHFFYFKYFIKYSSLNVYFLFHFYHFF